MFSKRRANLDLYYGGNSVLWLYGPFNSVFWVEDHPAWAGMFV